MKCPFCIKKCGKCGELLVAWSGNFVKRKASKDGLASQCKRCKKKYRNQYYQEHKEEELKKSRRYKEEHREEIKEQRKGYYEEHKEERAEYDKQYRINNPHVVFNYHNKRRNKLKNQGRGTTKEQWLEMMKFFEFKCAYSGTPLKEGINRSVDHLDCIDNGGLNEIWNLVPMHMPYNSSKHNSEDMLDWYKKQPFFSEERLNKIYEWVEYAWNKWGYETESEIVFNYCDLNDETIERYFEEELEEII